MKNITIILLSIALVVLGYFYIKKDVQQETVLDTASLVQNTSQAEIAEQQNTVSNNTAPSIKNTNTLPGAKTYTNKNFNISFVYQDTGSVLDTSNGFTVRIPFQKKYDVWTSKSLTFSFRKGESCTDYGAGMATTSTVINGKKFLVSDPDWKDTSGMSSISKIKTYFYESTAGCYMFSEVLSGLGTNEHSANATAPNDTSSFIDSELKDLDSIMQSIQF